MSSAYDPDVPREPAPTADSKFRNSRERKSIWLALLALAWLLGFLLYFYSFTLPNNPAYNRLGIWINLPELLAANIVGVEKQAERSSSGWRYFPQRLDLLLVAGAILAGAWGSGSLLLRLLRVPPALRPAERALFAMALGLSGLSLLTLVCGLLGFLSPWWFAGILAASVLFELGARTSSVALRRANSAHVPERSAGGDRRRTSMLLAVLCIAAATPFLLAMLLGALLPPTDFDVREYHLQGPKEFFEAGRVQFLPHNVYTSFPFLTEMLSLLAMVLRNDWYRGALAGKAVLMSFAPLTGLALYAGGRRLFGPAAGWSAALVYLTTPWTYRISIIALAEGGLSFYLFASLLALIIAAQRLHNDERANRHFLLCGLLAGSAMACKYTGAVQVVIPLAVAGATAAFAVGGAGMRQVRAALLTLAVYSLGVLLTVGPWLAKNAVQTRNPIYPLLYTVLDGRDWNAEMNEKWRIAHSAAEDGHSLSYWLVDVSARNDWLSPLLFGLAPLALLVPGRIRATALLWLYVLFLFFAWWGLTHRLDRFWVPMIPVVALLAGGGAAWSLGRVWRYGCAVLVALAVIFNLGMVTSPLAGFNAFLADLDEARAAAEATAPGIAFLNRFVPRGAKVLCVGEAQVFDARVPLVYNTVFDNSIFRQWFAQQQPDLPEKELPLKSGAAIREKLAAEGITHVLVNWSEVLRYRTSYGYTPFVTPERFLQLREMGALGSPIVVDYRSIDGLADKQRTEMETWGRALIVEIRGEPAFKAIEVYAVPP